MTKQQTNMSKTTDYNKFIDVWLEAMEAQQTQEWVAEKMGMSRQRVSQLAMYLRTRGVNLPKMTAHLHQLTETSIEALNEKIRLATERVKDEH